MKTKNIQDVVAEFRHKYDGANIANDGGAVATRYINEMCDYLTTTLTQLVKEVEVGERKRIYDSFADCPSFDDALNEREALNTPPTSDIIEK